MGNLLRTIQRTRTMLQELAADARLEAVNAHRNEEMEQVEELDKLTGWASSASSKLGKLLDPEGANLLCEFLGQMPMFPRRESYPGERADNAPVPRSNGVSSVTISSGDQSVTMTDEQFDRATDEILSGGREHSEALAGVITSALGRNG